MLISCGKVNIMVMQHWYEGCVAACGVVCLLSGHWEGPWGWMLVVGALTVLVWGVSVSVVYSDDVEVYMGKRRFPYRVVRQRAWVLFGEAQDILRERGFLPPEKRVVFTVLWTTNLWCGMNESLPHGMAGMGRDWSPWWIKGGTVSADRHGYGDVFGGGTGDFEHSRTGTLEFSSGGTWRIREIGANEFSDVIWTWARGERGK